MKLGPIFIVVALLGPTRAVHAQADAMTIEAFLARAEGLGIERAAAALGVDVERARVDLARARPMPRIDVGLAQVDVSGQGATTSSYLGLMLPIELGARTRRLDYARANAAVAAADAEVVRLAYRRDAALAFIAALETEAELDVERRALASHERMLEVTARRLERGEITRGEMLDAELAMSRARIRISSLEQRLATRRVELATYLADPMSNVVPTGELDITHRDFDEAELVARALAQRPDLASMTLAITRADAEERLARNGRAPTIELTAAWTHNGRATEPQFAQHANDTLTVLIGLPLPSPVRRNAHVDVARAEHARWTAAWEHRRIVATVEVRTALITYQSARTTLDIFTRSIAPQLENSRQIASRSFDAGELTLVERLDVERRAYDLELESVRAKADHHRALVRLAAATGDLGRAR